MIGQQRDILIDTTLKNPPAAPQLKQPMEEDKVFKKPAPAVELVVEEQPQRKESQPPLEAAPPVATAADLPPPVAAAAALAPEKKKRVASDKLKTHLAKARARSLEVRRQKAVAKKAANLPAIPEDRVAPAAEPLPTPAAPPPMAYPPRAPVAAMDYDKIINGVVDRMSFNSEVDDEALRLITEDIRKEESAKARKDYEDRLADLERTKRQVAGKNAAVGILRGNRNTARGFGGAPTMNTNQLRGHASENPFDKCFW